jgi:NAD-dependent SIR2 family protein deacetylase
MLQTNQGYNDKLEAVSRKEIASRVESSQNALQQLLKKEIIWIEHRPVSRLSGSDSTDANPELSASIRGDIQLGQVAPDGAQLRPDIVWFGEEVPMMLTAAHITGLADVFVIIGTSLQVYPAAGLVQQVPAGVPIYIIDKNIPTLSGNSTIHSIEQPATVGVEMLWLALGNS